MNAITTLKTALSPHTSLVDALNPSPPQPSTPDLSASLKKEPLTAPLMVGGGAWLVKEKNW